jgi:hypothetical protein
MAAERTGLTPSLIAQRVSGGRGPKGRPPVQAGVSRPLLFHRAIPLQLAIRLQADPVILPTNLRMLPRSLSMPPLYLRTIEATVSLLLVSLQIGRADCRRQDGGKNAQQFQVYPRRRSQPLPYLRRQIRPRQALFLADRALFKEVR